MSLLNTDINRELDHMAKMLSMARDYARGQGFKGTFYRAQTNGTYETPVRF